MDRPISRHSGCIDLSIEPPFSVGSAKVNPACREAHYSSKAERLQPQNLKVLIALVQRRGEVVSRDELTDRCWNGRVVGEDVINHVILSLRQFAARAGGFVIETVPKSGYRLVDRPCDEERRPRSKRLALAAAAVFAFVSLGAWFAIDREAGSPPAPTIAILPFGASGEPASRTLAADARDALSHTLSNSGFPVTLAAAAKDQSSPADFIITGDVKHVGAVVTATVRMEDSKNKVIVFSRRYTNPASEARWLPERIGAQVAGELSWTGALMILDRRHPSDPVVVAELLRSDQDGVESSGLQAYEVAQRVARKAPTSAMGQLGLAFGTAFVLGELPRDRRPAAVQQGRTAASQALKLAPDFGDAYVPLCLLDSNPLRTECEDRYRAGIAIDPDAPFADWFLADLLSEVGRNREALEFARASRARNPYMPAKLGLLLEVLGAMGRIQEAQPVYVQASRWYPEDGSIFWKRLAGLTQSGDFARIAGLGTTGAVQKPPDWFASVPEVAGARLARDLGSLQKLCRNSKGAYTDALCMIALAQLGDMDAAYSIADRIYPARLRRTRGEQERNWLDEPQRFPLAFITGPSAAALRRDPRYLNLAQRTGLLSYWRAGRLPDFCKVAREPICKSIVRSSIPRVVT